MTKDKIHSYLKDIVFAIVAYIVLSSILFSENLFQQFGGIFHHLMVILIAILIAKSISLYNIRSQVSILLSHDKTIPPKIRKPLSIFIENDLLRIGDLNKSLLGPKGIIIDELELDKFVAACFEANGKCGYIGTDSNTPTEFYRLYSTYLDNQLKLNKKWLFWASISRHIRFLFVSYDELKINYNSGKANKLMFQRFCDWHVQNDVQLLQVDKDIAKQLAQSRNMRSTDIGVFGWRFVVFYTPITQPNGPNRYQINMEPMNDDIMGRLREYLKLLNDEARELRLRNGHIQCIERNTQAKNDDLKERIMW